jgi:Ni/Fe-hydrogenase 1 B-type cytochrome subunit
MAEPLERVYVWEVPVRLTHWVNVLAILTLSATGLYIGNPVFLGGTGAVMSGVRALHRITAYLFVASVALRIYWAFAGNAWASWRVLFPYLTRQGRAELVQTFLYYTFLRRRPPAAVGHNALASLAYFAVAGLIAIEILTGFALQSVGAGGWRALAFGWVFSLGGFQTVRLVHHMVMWLLLGFMVHHVYSVLLMESEERNGLMTSIFSGYKFVRRRA